MKRCFLLLLVSLLTLALAAQTPVLTRPVVIESTTLSGFSRALSHPDTLLPFSYRHHPLYRLGDAWAELGNTGQCAIPASFQGIPDHYLIPGHKALDPYFRSGNSLTRYLIRSPFSMINFNTGGAEDKHGQTIRALYSRNLSAQSNLSASLTYDAADGHYASQKSSASDVNLNYYLDKGHYQLWSGLSIVNQKQAESGGIKNDSDLQLNSSYPTLVAVNLTDAQSKNRIISFNAIQRFDLSRWPVKPKVDSLPESDSLQIEPFQADSLSPAMIKKTFPFKLEHRIGLWSSYRVYEDIKAGAGFYEALLIDSTATHDSVGLVKIENQFLLVADSLNTGKILWRLYGGLKPVFFQYFRANERITGVDLAALIMAETKGRRGAVNIQSEVFALGHRAGDFDLSGSYRLGFGHGRDSALLSATVSTMLASPNPLLLSFKSNHFEWSRDFSRQRSLTAGLRFDMPLRRLHASVQLHRLDGWIYFDAEALPAQMDGSAWVGDVRLSKEFSAGPFRSSLRLQGQYSSDANIPLPLAVAGMTTWMHHDIHFKTTGGDLQLEYGVEGRYSTPWAGYAWMPATGIFYLQHERMLGNYPALEAFLQVKIKRTRIFVQYNHLLRNLFWNEYYGALHYPYPIPHLKYGVYWHF